MKNRFKKLAIICIAFIGIFLVATAAVNLFSPRAEIISATNNYEGAVYIVIGYINANYVELYECSGTEPNLLYSTSVENETTIRSCSVMIPGLTPGLYELKVVAGNSEREELESDPFYIYVNAVEP